LDITEQMKSGQIAIFPLDTAELSPGNSPTVFGMPSKGKKASGGAKVIIADTSPHCAVRSSPKMGSAPVWPPSGLICDGQPDTDY
jgi:hypothetical protein